MLFLARCPSPTTPSGRYATCAAIRCLIAYAEGLEDCHIDVAAIEGAIVLSGVSSNDEARQRAIAIAAEYDRTRIVSSITLRADRDPSSRPQIERSNSPAPSGQTAAPKTPKETS
ncbi:BON domain-containing protein [Rhizobium sp. AG207R]|uniref:BON domain-containing protein n=1 Tax=Rhizobium sp. AG207R TaxID=2802287 RepID=UPI0022ABC68B|nr:BON domain-containing protein [Rhizobium sp. AG207R]MCZ3376585.1 BON domain-containing protein [Rhizobium sp. AG207R]